LIGAYTETLALMRQVGATPEALLLRMPLQLQDAKGHGLRLRNGPVALTFGAAVFRNPGWSAAEKLALLAFCAKCWLIRFQCAPTLTVSNLAASLPPRVRRGFIEPLCIAALNTPACSASAKVFLRVLHDALLTGPGSSDLLIPQTGLSALLPDPASGWLSRQPGCTVRLRQEVRMLQPEGMRWLVNEEPFDAVVVATTPWVAARLLANVAPGWAKQAQALTHAAIATVYLKTEGAQLPAVMLAVDDNAGTEPVQFVFDLQRLQGRAGLLALVASGAQAWVERGQSALEFAALAQMQRNFPNAPWVSQARVVRTTVEKRATFACTPGIERPKSQVAASLAAAGDYIDGPYPATLEGAVRSGKQAVNQLLGLA
jgi:hydroxysqualene dehydroxylase